VNSPGPEEVEEDCPQRGGDTNEFLQQVTGNRNRLRNDEPGGGVASGGLCRSWTVASKDPSILQVRTATSIGFGHAPASL